LVSPSISRHTFTTAYPETLPYVQSLHALRLSLIQPVQGDARQVMIGFFAPVMQ